MGTIYNPSDVNLKTNIEEITKLDIENLGNLEPKKYVLKNDESKSPHYGLIAQDEIDNLTNIISLLKERQFFPKN